MTKHSDSYSYSACGKAILLGEHFVVHGVPAVAVPVTGLQTTVTASPLDPPSAASWHDPSLDPAETILAAELLRVAQQRLGSTRPYAIRAHSTIPRGYGLGSSASLAVALCGALARAEGQSLPRDELREHAHALETVVHGKPSGIDDATVAWSLPLAFRRGEAPRPLSSPLPLTLVLASSTKPIPTREAVAQVSRQATADPAGFAALCQRARDVVRIGTAALVEGDPRALGAALDTMQQLLTALGVSSAGLDRLIASARAAGAWGAKLTGAGLGGFMLALVEADKAEAVGRALRDNGAEHTFVTVIPAVAPAAVASTTTTTTIIDERAEGTAV